MAASATTTVFVLASVTGFAFNKLLRSWREDGDTGVVWAHVLKGQTLLFSSLFILSSLIKNAIPPFWEQGYHLYFDITGIGGMGTEICYFVSLALPFLSWAVLIILYREAKAKNSRWACGHIDTNKKRQWVLLLCVPLGLVLVFAFPRVGGGQFAYPGALWGLLATLFFSIVGIGLTREGQPVAQTEGPLSEKEADCPPADWADVLKKRGIEVENMFVWEKSTSSFKEKIPGAMAMDIQRNLRLRGAKNISQQMIKAFSEIIESPGDPNDSHGNSRLIFTPENCGENEIVSIVSKILHQRFRTVTLVIMPKEPEKKARLFKKWVPDGDDVAVLRSGNHHLPERSYLWVADAETVSEGLLPDLKDPAIVRRIGLVVWWDLHDYTGVSGANLWGISHRLHRVINSRGRQDVRTVVFVGKTADASTQHSKFIRRLLPHPFYPKTEVHIEPHFFKEIRLYFLKSQKNFFRKKENQTIVSGDARHPTVIAAKVSMEEKWPTYLDEALASNKLTAESLLQVSVSNSEGKKKLDENLCQNSVDAGVRLLELQPANALSLSDTISQGGRTFSANHPVHIGCSFPENPYIHHLVSRLKAVDNTNGFNEGRRLVGASAHPSIVERHLIRALNELPDTHSGLQKDFQFAEEVIEKTLNKIASEDKLIRKEVRFLDKEGRLVREPEYQNQVPPDVLQRPLDTVGTTLITVREKVGGHDDNGIRLLVDPERVLIQAYPGRVFMHRGWRYRIENWESMDEVLKSREIACEKENDFLQTLRWRRYFFDDFNPKGNTTSFGSSGKFLAKTSVTLTYEESLKGYVEVYSGGDNGVPDIKPIRIGEPIHQSFSTTALIIHLERPDDGYPVRHMELVSLCQALRHVLPVHVGIEENALEIVPVMGEYIQDTPVYGIALVDLYPGGIGLIDAMEEDIALIRRVLQSAFKWLDACTCADVEGCGKCLASPASLAANYPLRPKKAQALEILKRVV